MATAMKEREVPTLRRLDKRSDVLMTDSLSRPCTRLGYVLRPVGFNLGFGSKLRPPCPFMVQHERDAQTTSQGSVWRNACQERFVRICADFSDAPPRMEEASSADLNNSLSGFEQFAQRI